MGTFTDNLSKRIRHTKINEGYCLVCGKFGRLSSEHVPPKCAINITKVEQRHITEMMGANARKVKGVASPNGSKFRTVCRVCNNQLIGACDNEVGQVFSSLSEKVKAYFQYCDSLSTVVSTDINSLTFCRAMIGHILAATSVDECKTEPTETPYFTPLQNFVLGDDLAIRETHDIFYWFYPYTRHLSAKLTYLLHDGHHVSMSLLSFFPLAFLVVEKGKGVYPGHAQKLSLDDSRIHVDLSARWFEFAEFPFHELKGNQMLALSDQMAIVSYPVGQ